MNVLCSLANAGANYLLELSCLYWDVATYHGPDAGFGVEGCAKHKMLMGKLGEHSSYPFNLSILEGLSVNLQWMVSSNIKHRILQHAKNSKAV